MYNRRRGFTEDGEYSLVIESQTEPVLRRKFGYLLLSIFIVSRADTFQVVFEKSAVLVLVKKAVLPCAVHRAPRLLGCFRERRPCPDLSQNRAFDVLAAVTNSSIAEPKTDLSSTLVPRSRNRCATSFSAAVTWLSFLSGVQQCVRVLVSECREAAGLGAPSASRWQLVSDLD